MAFTSYQEGIAMEPPGENKTRELSESMNGLAASEARWARLIGKFLKRLDIPPHSNEPDDIQQA